MRRLPREAPCVLGRGAGACELEPHRFRVNGIRSSIVEPEFRTVIESEDGTVTINVFGELDMATCEELRCAIEAQYDAAIVVDLSGVTFMDSSGLAVLIRAQQHLEGALTVRAASKPVRSVFRVAGVSDLFDCR